MGEETTTYEEWRAVGHIAGEPYEFTWSPQRNPHLGDPEDAARRFIAIWEGEGIPIDLHLHKRTVTVTEWRVADIETGDKA